MTRKHDNFVRLAEARVNKALDAIRILGNLSNTAYYEYSSEEVREIVSALNAAVADLRSQFTLNSQSSKSGFKFSESAARSKAEK